MKGCEAYRMCIHRLLDGETLSEAEQAQMRAHEAQCPACCRERDILTHVHAQCAALDDTVEVPTEFSQNWRKSVRAEAARRKQKPSYRLMTTVAAGVLVVALGGAGMVDHVDGNIPGAGQENSSVQFKMARSSVTADYGAAYSMDMAAAESSEAESGDVTSAAKRIRSASIDLRTSDFDGAMEQLRMMPEQFGGYVGNENLYGVAGEEARSAYLDVWVEASTLDTFLVQAAELGEVKSRSAFVQDVTDSYTDTSGRLESAKARRERLNELVAQAQDMSELIELEDALSDVQQTIERYERTLKDWDKRVQYASVSVSLEEKRSEDAVREGDMGLLARMRSALTDSVTWLGEFMQGVLVFIVAAMPVAAAAGIAALAGWGMHKMIKAGKRRKKKE